MKTVLTIAGTDPSGGAGLQADLKTMTALGTYGMAVTTAIVVQNTCGVSRVELLPPDLILAQLEAVLSDIPPDAVKIGMVGGAAALTALSRRLSGLSCPIVVDPVMVSTSGHRLLEPRAQAALERGLLPLATVMTPNLPEAEALLRRPIPDRAAMEQAAADLAGRYPGAILIKGGHLAGHCDDLLWAQGRPHWLPGTRVDTTNTHGTGCTLSTALSCGLAQGLSLEEAARRAKAYVAGGLRAGLALGRGNGPLDHTWNRQNDGWARTLDSGVEPNL